MWLPGPSGLTTIPPTRRVHRRAGDTGRRRRRRCGARRRRGHRLRRRRPPPAHHRRSGVRSQHRRTPATGTACAGRICVAGSATMAHRRRMEPAPAPAAGGEPAGSPRRPGGRRLTRLADRAGVRLVAATGAASSSFRPAPRNRSMRVLEPCSITPPDTNPSRLGGARAVLHRAAAGRARGVRVVDVVSVGGRSGRCGGCGRARRNEIGLIGRSHRQLQPHGTTPPPAGAAAQPAPTPSWPGRRLAEHGGDTTDHGVSAAT